MGVTLEKRFPICCSTFSWDELEGRTKLVGERVRESLLILEGVEVSLVGDAEVSLRAEAEENICESLPRIDGVEVILRVDGDGEIRMGERVLEIRLNAPLGVGGAEGWSGEKAA